MTKKQLARRLESLARQYEGSFTGKEDIEVLKEVACVVGILECLGVVLDNLDGQGLKSIREVCSLVASQQKSA